MIIQFRCIFWPFYPYTPSVTQPLGSKMPHKCSNCADLIQKISRVAGLTFGIDKIAIMKSIGKILFFAFFILCMFLLKPRQDVVFEAIDVSQYIKLFEEDRDFVLCIGENGIFTGTYSILADTVFLSYKEQLESSIAPTGLRQSAFQTLPKKLYIDESDSKIESSDGQLFTAEIFLDMREKSYEATAYSPSELESYKAQILAIVGIK
jgi:hypothetical protein